MQCIAQRRAKHKILLAIMPIALHAEYMSSFLYQRFDQVLILGDGDFSFSLSLAARDLFLKELLRRGVSFSLRLTNLSTILLKFILTLRKIYAFYEN